MSVMITVSNVAELRDVLKMAGGLVYTFPLQAIYPDDKEVKHVKLEATLFGALKCIYEILSQIDGGTQ